MVSNREQYGVADASFNAAGREVGIRRLVECFYAHMDVMSETQHMRAMHPEDLAESIDKIACFLCGWLGGPRLFQKKYGSISIPDVHRHLNIGEAERDAWLMCMQKAVEEQPFDASFKIYLMQQLAIPAQFVRHACAEWQMSETDG